MSVDFITLSHSFLQTLKPYQAGKPIEEVQRELGISDVIKVASNENPLGASPKATQAALEAISRMSFYPDASGYQLKKRLSETLDVPVAHLTLGNGSDNILSLLMQAYGKDKSILVSAYSFDNYVLIARGHGVDAVTVPAKNWTVDVHAMVEALKKDVQHNIAMIFVANPNNPTGTYINHEALEFLLKNTPPHVLVISDEAYHEYVTAEDYPKTHALQKQYPNLIITRTFSKAYGLAGLRVGYGVSHPQIADVLNRIRLPFNVSIPAMEAATAALDDVEHLKKTQILNQKGKAYLMNAMEIMGLSVIPSQTNFITVDMRRDTAPLFQKLLKMGIIVRPLHTYSMPNHFRITIGLDEQNERVAHGIKTLVEEMSQ